MKVLSWTATNGTEVHFTVRNPTYDYNHTLVVFSGFTNQAIQARPLGSYDFQNALDQYPGRIIWIDDYFDGAYGYYVSSHGTLRPAQAVQEFIQCVMHDYGLVADDVTFTGFSKGGSAALYHGMLADVRNIVVTVPQFFIGSYVDAKWPAVAQAMFGSSYESKHIEAADTLITQAIDAGFELNPKRNIILLSSKKDNQYVREIESNLAGLERFSNFNLILTESWFVRRHNQVTAHHVPLLLGCYYLLASEAPPSFNDSGPIVFRGRKPAQSELKPSERPEVFCNLTRFNMKGSVLFVEGELAQLGYRQEKHADVSFTLVLRSQETGEVRYFKLGSMVKPYLTRKLNKDTENVALYDAAYFATPQRRGIDLSSLPLGTYRLAVISKVKDNDNIPIEVPLASKREGGVASDYSEFHLRAAGGYAEIARIPIGKSEDRLSRLSARMDFSESALEELRLGLVDVTKKERELTWAIVSDTVCSIPAESGNYNHAVAGTFDAGLTYRVTLSQVSGSADSFGACFYNASNRLSALRQVCNAYDELRYAVEIMGGANRLHLLVYPKAIGKTAGESVAVRCVVEQLVVES